MVVIIQQKQQHQDADAEEHELEEQVTDCDDDDDHVVAILKEVTPSVDSRFVITFYKVIYLSSLDVQ